jgi:hypothetical protein
LNDVSCTQGTSCTIVGELNGEPLVERSA